jgi:tetratricopeptide (TPR) repeat protein
MVVKGWDLTTGLETFTFQAKSVPGGSLCFSPDGKRLAKASDTVTLWDPDTRQEVLTIRPATSGVRSACFSPDGKRLAGACYDNTLRVWDATTGQEALTLKGHTGMVHGVCWSPDGQRLASASNDGTVRAWDAATGQATLTFRGQRGMVRCVCFSPDGKRLASSGQGGVVKVWDSSTGQELLSLKGQVPGVSSVCFSPDGKFLASGGGGSNKVRVWDATTEQEPFSFPEQPGGVFGVCFSPDGRWLALAKWDGTVRLEEAPPDVAAARAARLAPSAARVAAHLVWHRAEAASAEQAGRWFAARLHLDRLLDAEPDNGDLHLRRAVALGLLGQQEEARRELARARMLKVDLTSLGEAYAQLDQWEDAAATLVRAVESPEATARTWRGHALVCLHQGDRDAYRRACAAMLERFRDPTDPDSVQAVAWACGLAPGAVNDLGPAIGLAEKTLETYPEEHLLHRALAALLLRAGKPEAAIEQMDHSSSGVRGNFVRRSPAEHLIVARVHQQCGHVKKAKVSLDEAAQDLALAKFLPWDQQFVYSLLRREVESTINGTKPEAPPDTSQPKKDRP